VWEQLRQSITAKFGGADALKAALEADQAGVQALVVGALGFEEVDYFLTAAAPYPPCIDSLVGIRGGQPLRGLWANRGHGSHCD
jgi:hypothetical protein